MSMFALLRIVFPDIRPAFLLCSSHVRPLFSRVGPAGRPADCDENQYSAWCGMRRLGGGGHRRGALADPGHSASDQRLGEAPPPLAARPVLSDISTRLWHGPRIATYRLYGLDRLRTAPNRSEPP